MFVLTEEQNLLKDALDSYLPEKAARDGKAWSVQSWRKLAEELGILAAPFPEDLGGAGGGVKDAMVVMQALGEHCIVHPYLDTTIMAGRALLNSDNARRAALIEGIASGKTIVAIAHLEENARVWPINVAVRATQAGEGFRLSGIKRLVRAAPWSTHLLVATRTAGETGDAHGISLFLIERDRPGVTFREGRFIDSYAFADVTFDDVAVTKSDLLGPLHGGYALTAQMLDDGAAGLCAEAVGLMRGMIAQTVEYMRQRIQFGKPLSSFQALQHRLVNMQLALEQATSLAHAAAAALDKAPEDRALIVSAAKYTAGKALNLIGREAVQMHGAVGAMEETAISRYFKRSIAIQRECGAATEHLERFAARAGETLFDADEAAGGILGRIADTRESDQDAAAFRREVQGFLATNLTPELKAENSWETASFAQKDLTLEWQRRLAARNWAAPAWPREHGGPGWSARQRQVFEEEMAKAHAPKLPAMGLLMCGPVVMRFGTDAQKQYFLPRILSGEHFWCQGYSEPNAGSDLASLQSRATRDGDHYVLNGSKIWTTFAHYANWIFVLARTKTDGKPQGGISFLLLPMDTPGLTVRPIISVSGEHEVNQVFFDNVRVPVENRVGEENDGWRVAKYLLEFERGTGHQVPCLVMDLARLRDIARQARSADGQILWESDEFRRRFAALEIQALAIRLSEERLIYSLPTGQNVGDFAASFLKLTCTETVQDIHELAMEAIGPYAGVDQADAFETHDTALAIGPDYARTQIRRYLNDRIITIAGGSSEVQRNILARVLFNI